MWMETGTGLQRPRCVREGEIFETKTRPGRQGPEMPTSTDVCGGHQILLVVVVLKHFHMYFSKEGDKALEIPRSMRRFCTK